VPSQQTTARILIVDDHPLVREGLKMRLSAERDLEVCGQAASEDEAAALLKQTQPDLMIVDISLNGGNGLDLIKRATKHHPTVRILVLSGFQESLYGERVLRAGAMGYVNKQTSNDTVIGAIRTLLQGKRYVSEDLVQRLAMQALTGRDKTQQPIERLTARELEIFRLIGDGLSSGAIAERLYLSTHTIDTHRENIKRKLGVKSGAELTRQAVQWSIEQG
jgi:DNA-binding NarL/FixJ family response regulator